MCVICRGESLEGLTELNCGKCIVLTSIPIIEGLKRLDCHSCPNLTNIFCPSSLKCLKCYSCEKLVNIEFPHGGCLEILDCSDCISIVKLPKIDIELELNCECCTSLTTILSEFIEDCRAEGCHLLTYVGADDVQSFASDSNWVFVKTIYEDDDILCRRDFDERICKLINLQRIVRRYLLRLRLNKIIPLISEIYYSPGCRGAWIAEKNFRLNCV
jgi:hypothetical protein